MAGQPGPRIGRGSLVVGDPATDPARGMRRLPGARVEAITVARVLGTTEETARWRVFKARQKLMKVLSPELLPPGTAAGDNAG